MKAALSSPNAEQSLHHRKPSTASPDRQSQDETRVQVRACIDQLPAQYREILILRDIEELDTEETTKVLGISNGSVKTRLHRARQALRTLLEPVFAN